MVLRRPSIKIVQIILIGWKIWPPGGVTSFSYVNIGKIKKKQTFFIWMHLPENTQ